MTDCDSLQIVFAGTPDFAATALQGLIGSQHRISGVLTQPDRPAGRGRKLVASAVKQLAEENDIPVQQPLSLRDEEVLHTLKNWPCDVMVVAAYGLMLPQAVLDWPMLGCLNIHASLLPRWRGAAPIQRAILAGDVQSGVCIMKMDAGLDTGDIVQEATVPINSATTGGDLHDALAALGKDLLLETLSPFCSGSLPFKAQPKEGISYATKLDKAEAVLDFGQSAQQLHRQIQAFNPWPVSETRLNGERIRIWRSRLPETSATQDNDEVTSGNTLKAATKGVPGAVIRLEDDAVIVSTGNGTLALTMLQRPGKKPLSAGDFCRGLELKDQVFG